MGSSGEDEGDDIAEAGCWEVDTGSYRVYRDLELS
jgi:hypothetical protein